MEGGRKRNLSSPGCRSAAIREYESQHRIPSDSARNKSTAGEVVLLPPGHDGSARLGSARLGSARLGPARLGSADSNRHVRGGSRSFPASAHVSR